jgi:hypothetical protein
VTLPATSRPEGSVRARPARAYFARAVVDVPAPGSDRYLGSGGKPSPASTATALMAVSNAVRTPADMDTRIERWNTSHLLVRAAAARSGGWRGVLGMLGYAGADVKYF